MILFHYDTFKSATIVSNGHQLYYLEQKAPRLVLPVLLPKTMSGKSSATVSPPLVALSDTNHAGQVSVVALSFLMIAILAAGAKEIMACVRKVWTMQVDFPIMFSLVRK